MGVPRMAGHGEDNAYSRDNEACAVIASVMCGWLHNTRWVVESFVLRYSNVPHSNEEKAN
jgi:hypothetical protein